MDQKTKAPASGEEASADSHRQSHALGERDDNNQRDRRRATGFPIIVHEWRLSARELARVKIDEKHGRVVIDARIWLQHPSGEIRPGRRGLTLDVQHLDALTGSLVAAVGEARARGLLRDSDA